MVGKVNGGRCSDWGLRAGVSSAGFLEMESRVLLVAVTGLVTRDCDIHTVHFYFKK